MSRYLLLFFLTLAFASQVRSQSSYLERGQSGIGVSGDFFSNQTASATGGSLGYSINSALDAGLSISNISPSQKLGGQPLYAAAVALSLTFTAVKEDATNPVSLSFRAADLSYKYTSPALSNANVTTEPTGFSVGASMYRNIIVSPTIKLQPETGVYYMRIIAGVKDNYGNIAVPRYNSAVLELGLSILFQTGPTTIIGITPSFELDKDTDTFDLSAGVVFIL